LKKSHSFVYAINAVDCLADQPERVPGLCYRDDFGRPLTNPTIGNPDKLDQLPWPKRRPSVRTSTNRLRAFSPVAAAGGVLTSWTMGPRKTNDHPVPSGSLRLPLVPCCYIWPCRDRATTTCNLLDFNGTESPFFL